MLADTIYYPKISCLCVIPDNLEHTGPTGVVLTWALGIQFDAKPENDDPKELHICVESNGHWAPPPGPMMGLVVIVLKFVARTPSPVATAMFPQW